MNRRRLVLGITAGLLAPHTFTARAQDAYPNKPIKMVIPSSPGGVHDIIARIWADKVADGLGTVYVENKAGAGSIIGTVEVARAQPDGYTLLLGSNTTHVLAPLQQPNIAFNPVSDFELVTVFATTSLALLVRSDLPVKDVQGLIAFAKAQPGKLSYAHAGLGTSTHVTAELFKKLAGNLDIVAVPYRGMGPAMMDVVSNRVDLMFANLTAQIVEFHTSGKMKMIGVTSPERMELVPDIRTIHEQGLADFASQSFFGIYAPAKTPVAIVSRINQATAKALDDGAFRKKLADAGYDPLRGMTPQKSAAYMKAEIDKWRPIMAAIEQK
jgi:tripartite-type tricarboxylate transporter receptor subunit TctC